MPGGRRHTALGLRGPRAWRRSRSALRAARPCRVTTTDRCRRRGMWFTRIQPRPCSAHSHRSPISGDRRARSRSQSAVMTLVLAAVDNSAKASEPGGHVAASGTWACRRKARTLIATRPRMVGARLFQRKANCGLRSSHAIWSSGRYNGKVGVCPWRFQSAMTLTQETATARPRAPCSTDRRRARGWATDVAASAASAARAPSAVSTPASGSAPGGPPWTRSTATRPRGVRTRTRSEGRQRLQARSLGSEGCGPGLGHPNRRPPSVKRLGPSDEEPSGRQGEQPPFSKLRGQASPVIEPRGADALGCGCR